MTTVVNNLGNKSTKLQIILVLPNAVCMILMVLKRVLVRNFFFNESRSTDMKVKSLLTRTGYLS